MSVHSANRPATGRPLAEANRASTSVQRSVCALPVGLELGQQACIAPRELKRHGLVNLEAISAPRTEARQRDQVAVALEQLFDVDPDVFPNLGEGAPETRYA